MEHALILDREITSSGYFMDSGRQAFDCSGCKEAVENAQNQDNHQKRQQNRQNNSLAACEPLSVDIHRDFGNIHGKIQDIDILFSIVGYDAAKSS